MININDGVRLTQNINSKMIKGNFILYNSKIGVEAEINYLTYQIIKKVNECIVRNMDELYKLTKRYSRNTNQIIKQLFNYKILSVCDKKNINKNILPVKRVKYPLSYLALELTDNCNLNCIHCYGQFGRYKQYSNLTYEYLKSIKKDIDLLHTRSIALTGGEVLTHKEFEKIAMFFLKNGFNVVIFSNGYNYKRMENFLELSKDYHMTIKISIDGLNNTHNLIRGRKNSYENAIKMLDILKKYDNVDTDISTVIMRENLKEIDELIDIIKNRYPKFTHQLDIISPILNARKNQSLFTLSEIQKIYNRYPKVFLQESPIGLQKYRCTGGVTSAAISSSKVLKICVGAEDPEFQLGDLNKDSLLNIWKHPSSNGKRFRQEGSHDSYKCKKCSLKKKCNTVNCRLLAQGYKNDSSMPNPLTCMAERIKQSENNF